MCAVCFRIFPYGRLRRYGEDSWIRAPVAGETYLDRTEWWDYILSLPAPRVMVVQDVATRPGLASLLGAVHINILRALGCVGAVTNGRCATFRLPKTSVSTFCRQHLGLARLCSIVEFGRPVEIGGLKIQSGDLLHGDPASNQFPWR